MPKTLKMWVKVQKSLPKIHDKKIALTHGNNLHNLHQHADGCGISKCF